MQTLVQTHIHFVDATFLISPAVSFQFMPTSLSKRQWHVMILHHLEYFCMLSLPAAHLMLFLEEKNNPAASKFTLVFGEPNHFNLTGEKQSNNDSQCVRHDGVPV